MTLTLLRLDLLDRVLELPSLSSTNKPPCLRLLDSGFLSRRACLLPGHCSRCNSLLDLGGLLLKLEYEMVLDHIRIAMFLADARLRIANSYAGFVLEIPAHGEFLRRNYFLRWVSVKGTRRFFQVLELVFYCDSVRSTGWTVRGSWSIVRSPR